jgi:hypothetical protein
MYFSAEHLAAANKALHDTFQQCSIAWQSIPHWDTKDPGQINVSNGILGSGANFLPLVAQQAAFQLTVAEAISPTPDALLTGVMAATETLAKTVDGDVLQQCYADAATTITITPAIDAQVLQNALINARVNVENAGYRAPSALVTNTTGLTNLNLLANGYYNILQQTLAAANVNSLYRFDPLDAAANATTNQTKARMVFLGRRRRIAQGAAPEAAAGEEPVDIAVSLPPSLEVDGETSTGTIQLSVRIRYATRITDATGLVAIAKS